MSNNEYRAEIIDGDFDRPMREDERDRPMPGFGGFTTRERGEVVNEIQAEEPVNLFHDVFRGDNPIPIIGFSFKEKINLFLKILLIISILFLCGIILFHDGSVITDLNLF